jgi:hypothetical protein
MAIDVAAKTLICLDVLPQQTRRIWAPNGKSAVQNESEPPKSCGFILSVISSSVKMSTLLHSFPLRGPSLFFHIAPYYVIFNG